MIEMPKQGTLIAGIPFDKNRRGQYWVFVVYPDSAPADWQENLAKQVEFVVSPLHDKDLTAAGEPKKAHYHVLCVWPNATTWNNAFSFCNMLNCPCCIPCSNLRLQYDYLTHKNDPNKAQYSESDIKCFNGFSIAKYINLTAQEVTTALTNVTKLCRDLQIIEYSDLIFYLLDNEMYNELDVAQRHTIYLTALIKGIWRTSHRYTIDPATGEVLDITNTPKEKLNEEVVGDE